MNALPLHIAYLVMSQLSPSVTPSSPAEQVAMPPAAMQPAVPGPSSPAAPAELYVDGVPKEIPPSGPTARITGISPGLSRVVPANAVTPLAPVSSANGVALAAMLIQDSMNAVEPTPFEGVPTSLMAAIQHVADTTVQRQAVGAYWRLSAAISRHAFADQEVEFLQQVPSPTDEDARAILGAALASAIARKQETDEAITLAQFDLLEQTYSTLSPNALPWPNDTPLVGSYRTNIDELFGDAVPPMRLQRIHNALPANKRVIEARADAVTMAQQSLETSRVAYQDGRLPVRSLLTACDRLHEEREAFLAAVLRYNESIAEYALAIVGPVADPATVVSTLIKWDGPRNNLVPIDPNVRPASVELPVDDRPRQAPPAVTAPPPAAADQQPPPQPPENVLEAGETRSVLRSIRVAHQP